MLITGLSIRFEVGGIGGRKQNEFDLLTLTKIAFRSVKF